MESPAVSRVRNQSVECFKLIGAVLVVLLHVPFPDKAHKLVYPLTNCVVPLFFAITGYYNYGANPSALRRRLVHLLKLYAFVILLTLLEGLFLELRSSGNALIFLRFGLPNGEELMRWAVLQADPRNGQLWYLASACLCYGIAHIYVSYFGQEPVDYRPLYFAAFSLFAVTYALGCLSRPVEMEVPFFLYRNAIYCGLPMFTLGIFLHEKQERFFANYRLTGRKLVLLSAGGCLFTILHSLYLGLGLMTLGTLLETAALLLLFVSHPRVTRGDGFFSGCISRFGSISTYIYLLHLNVWRLSQQFLLPYLQQIWTERAISWLFPWVVVALSTVVALLCTAGETLLSRRKAH